MTPLWTIRQAVAADRARLEPLVRAYIDFYREPQPSAARLDALLSLLVERPELGAQFVAEGGGLSAGSGELLGFATVYFSFETVAARRVATMNDLFVAPDDRNRGLGRALIEACHACAKDSDCALLQWVTAADNDTAQLLYDKLATRTSWVIYEMPC